MVQFLTLAILILLPGYAGWLVWGSGLRGRLTAVTTLFLILLTGIVIVAWPALFLAEVGLFSLPLLLIIVVVSSLLLAGWGLWRHGRASLNPFPSITPTDLLPFVLLSLAITLSPEPFEYGNGGRDHGIYVNTGIHIARTGSILFADPELAAVPAVSRPFLTNPLVAPFPALVPGPWSEGQRLAGLTIRDAAQGIVAPHAFHLYPVWIAIFYASGGVAMALWTTAVFNWLGLLAIYVTASHLLGKSVALLTLCLLILNISQLWFVHYPSAEILVRFFFWGGLLAFLLMLSYGNGYTAVLAGFSFGYLHLTKLDTFFVPILLLLILGTLWLQQKWHRQHTCFALAYGLISLHAALHALFIATIYFLDQLLRVLLPSFLAQPLIATIGEATYPLEIVRRVSGRFGLLILLIGLLLAGWLWLLHRIRQPLSARLAGLARFLRPGQVVVGLSLAALALYAVLLYPAWPLARLATTATTFTMLGWYLSLLGILLGVVGLTQFVIVSERPSHHAAWILLLGNILPLLLLGSGTFPDQFWAIRRFVPIVLPTFILFAAYLIWHLLPTVRQEWAKGLLPLGLALVLAILFWQKTKPVIGVVEYDGFIAQVQQLQNSLPPEAVLLFTNSDAANRVTLPLWTLFDRTLFAVEPEALADEDLATAVQQWQAQNRPVYLLDSRQETPVIMPDLAVTYRRTTNLSVPLIENRTDGVPQRVGRFLAVFDVYEFTTEPQPQTAVSLIVASGEDDVYLSGLYAPARLGGLTPLRWTSGLVELHFPTTERPSQLLLRLSNGRPATVPPASVAIFAGNTLLDTFTVTGSDEVYSLTISDDVRFAGETADFRLEITPWIPAETGYNADQRQLGVYLDWAKLIVTSGLERHE